MADNQEKLSRLKSRWDWGIWLSGFASLAILAFFSAVTVYSSDDYWYSTFWDKGFDHYLEMLDDHYRTFNGRTLVHILAHIILHFDNWAFVLACCGLCITGICAACYGAGVERHRIPAGVGFFLMGLLLMPRSYFNQGLMWISAFCNYMFPSVLICVFAALLEQKGKHLWLFAVAFFCGATTEQMGLASVALAAVYTIDALLRKKGVLRCLVSAVMALVGVWTIFQSPATQDRASSMTDLGDTARILEDIRKAIAAEAALLTETAMPVVLMLGFLVLAAVLIHRQTEKKWHIVVGAAGAIALVTGSVFGEFRVVGFVLAFLALAADAVLLMAGTDRYTGALMLAGLAGAAVMLVTKTIAARVMLPFYVLVLVCDCVMSVKLYTSSRSAGVCSLVCLGITVVYLIPALGGYWHNFKIDQQNLQYSIADRDSGVIRYCTDYDMDHTWNKADSDPYLKFKYLESIGLPEDTAVSFYSMTDRTRARVFCGETPLVNSAIAGANGEILLPLREIMQYYGGSVEWAPDCTIVRFGQTEYRLYVTDGTSARICWTDADGQPVEEHYAYKRLHGLTRYVETPFFEDHLSVSVDFDEEQFCYVVRP